MNRTLRKLLRIVLLPLSMASLVHAGGLDRAEPIGPYLDGALPSQTPRSASGSWETVDSFPEVILIDPIQMVPVPGTNQLLVAEKIGRLMVFENSSTSSGRNVILGIEDQTAAKEDSGLLGVAFHPEFGQEGSPNRQYLYVWYRYTPDTSEVHKAYLRLSRFEWNGTGTIDKTKEFVLINQFDRHNWHNGGGMFFGADGLLYFAVGDEGGSNDAFDVTQKRDGGLFSGIFRIDVDQDASRSHPIRRQPLSGETPPAGWPESYTQGYFIPNDNPWPSSDGSQLEEFWAIGSRSPYRMTQDPFTGRIWIGDVGQGARDEINWAVRGANFQWPFMEGTVTGPKSRPSNVLGVETPPIYDYGRSEGGCVIGGYVYRGSENPDLVGKYIFGDFNNGQIRAMSYTPGGTPTFENLGSVPERRLSGFGYDADGEIYAMTIGHTGVTEGGTAYRFQRSGITVPEPPATLSATGAFSDLPTLTPRAGLMPYDLIQPLWSDGADKKRWIAIPNDGTPDSPGEKIKFSETEPWVLPIGSVLIKHFEYAGRRLETRFFVRGSDGEYFGFTYKWRADNSDADLLPGPAVDETIDVGGGEDIEWHFPSRTECFLCHTDAAGTVLGPKTRHLNKDLFYPATGRTDNQLNTIKDLGFFSPGFDDSEIPGFLTAANINDPAESLERRMRSYLDINCSQCHQPGGPTQAVLDTRFTTPPNFQNMVNVTPGNELGLSAPKIIKPKSVPDSVLHLRMSSLDGCCAMPPLAKNAVDADAVRVLAEWIESLDPAISPQGYTAETPPEDHSVPRLTLSIRDGGPVVSGPFTVDLTASEPILGLTANDFKLVNATISSVAGSGAGWTVSVTPIGSGFGSIAIPSDKVTDENGNANLAVDALLFENAASGGANLLSNAGFENGLQAWDLGGSVSNSTEVRSGSGGARISENSYVVQSIPIAGGEIHTFSGFYKADSSVTRLEAGAIFFNSSGEEILDSFTLLSPTSVFSPFSLRLDVPSAAASAAVYILNSSGGSVVVDDLLLVRESGSGGGPPTNILTNGGFDSGSITPWDVGPTNVSFSTDARSGSHAALLDTESFVVHNMRATAGQEYRFGGYYKTSAPGGVHEVGIVFWGNDGSVLGETELSLPHSVDYAEFSVKDTSPEGTVSLSAWIYNGGTPMMKVDDTALFLVSGPENTSNSGDGNSPDAVLLARNGTRALLDAKNSSVTTKPAPVSVQPDLWVRGGKGGYRGDNEYGPGQKARRFTRSSRVRANFSIVWQNDAATHQDGAVLRVSGSSKGFKTKYFKADGVRVNLTGIIKTGRYRTINGAPGETESYTVKVRQGSRSNRLRFKSNLVAVSVLDPTRADTVQMKAIRRR